jgi:hypothetical protein
VWGLEQLREHLLLQDVWIGPEPSATGDSYIGSSGVRILLSVSALDLTQAARSPTMRSPLFPQNNLKFLTTMQTT